jgi:ATP phosphoribosyltransferase
MFVIALAKGRLLEPSLSLLSAAGIRFGENVAQSRKLIFNATDNSHRIVLVKPADVPTYVEYGAADAGFCGIDVLLESRADLIQPLSLNFGFCRIAVAAPVAKGPVTDGGHNSERPTIRVATKFPHITMEYFNARGIPVEIIPLAGSIELAPLLGLADRIVDLVETGRTLKENGLEIVDIITESNARLVVNRAAYQTKRSEVLGFVESLNKAATCASST